MSALTISLPSIFVGGVDALMVLISAYLNATQRVLTTETIAQAGCVELVHELPSVAAGFRVAGVRSHASVRPGISSEGFFETFAGDLPYALVPPCLQPLVCKAEVKESGDF